MEYRLPGYALLQGHGLEIGALHNPAPIPDHCTVDYCDVITKAEAIQLFPELEPDTIVEPVYICDLDTQGLQPIQNEQFDFVVISHVIEHVANPIYIVGEVLRVLKYGGLLVMVCPDKRYTFDRERQRTPFMHLINDYQNHVDTVTDDHFRDLLLGVYPHLRGLSQEELDTHIPTVRSRREHAHVWDSYTFKQFMLATLAILEEHETCLYEVYGEDTNLEYFSVWRREASGVHSASIDSQPQATSSAEMQNDVLMEPQLSLVAALENYTVRNQSLEASINQKNAHILALESLIQRIERGYVLRLLRGCQQVFKRVRLSIQRHRC